jgi:hypothetical protein
MIMTSSINTILAAEHIADLRRDAAHWGGVVRASATTPVQPIELRLVEAAESGDVHRLAALDEAPEPAGRVLLAVVDGEAVAGLSLNDQRVVANPFRCTRDAVALLRLRAEHLSGSRPRRRGLRRMLRLRAV